MWFHWTHLSCPFFLCVALSPANVQVPNAIMWYTGEFGDSDFDPEEAMFGDSEDDESLLRGLSGLSSYGKKVAFLKTKWLLQSKQPTLDHLGT